MSRITDCIHESWNPIRTELFKEPLTTLNQILPTISHQPEAKNIFRAFTMPVEAIRVVILGQDPYPIPGDAVGYAFAKPPLKKHPVSLRNIEKEVRDSGQINSSDEIDLFAWVDQGIFLLNTALTVETSRAGSHLKYWDSFTRRVISHISSTNPCIWILWGNKAQSFATNIHNKFSVKGYDRDTIKDIPYNDSFNYILSAPHPAAEAYAGGKAGFFGCDHFYLVNEVLKKNSKTPIQW